MRCETRTRIATGLVLLAVCSCLGPGENTPVPLGGPLSLKVGQTTAYDLYTHCGVLVVTINGTTYYADPPLSDGNANPPAGWGNPYDHGQITLTTATTADFSDGNGNKAHFISTPRGPAPTILPCE